MGYRKYIKSYSKSHNLDTTALASTAAFALFTPYSVQRPTPPTEVAQ